MKTQTNGEVHFITKKAFGNLLESSPYLTRIWQIEKSVHEVTPELHKEGFTHIIDLHKNLRSRVLNLSLKGKYLTYDKLNLEKWLLVNFKLDTLPAKHLVDRYFDALSVIEIDNDGAGLDYFIPPEEEIDLSMHHLISGKFICYAIGGAHATKRMTSDQISDICDQLSLPVLLVGGLEDRALGDSVFTRNTRVFNWCGKTTIHGSASLIRQCSLLITHDTGMMHVGAAFGKRIISIWGNTVPKFGMFPYYPKTNAPLNRIIEIHGLPCRPCSKIGHPACPKGHFYCIKKIHPNDVVTLAHKMLSNDG